MADLTPQERAVLDFARRRWNHTGARDEALLKELGLSPWRYSQLLLALTNRPAAWAAEPSLMKRMQERASRVRG